jgi:hypothetical protein
MILLTMISIVGMNHREWARRYGIRLLYGIKCPRCGTPILLNVPFATKSFRGIKSADHGCGEVYTRKVMVPWKRKKK